jgi:sigma-B regulation protein RsbU (phosphoserine phosphatase)
VPLGVSPDIPYDRPGEIELSPGDFLALFTDGFYEWPDAARQPFGPERLLDALRDQRHRPAAEMIAAAHRAARAFGGTRQRDDLTAVVVKRV